MRLSSIKTALAVGLAISLGPSTASAQGFAGILKKLDTIEMRLDGLEAEEGEHGQHQQVALAGIQSAPTEVASASEVASAREVADLRERLDRVSSGLEQVQTQVSEARTDPALSTLDSSVVALQLRLDRIADLGMEAVAGGESSTGVAQLNAELRSLIGELRSTMEQSSTRVIAYSGQVRPRSEYRSSAAGTDDRFTSMRVRAQMSAALSRDLDVLIQLQDVRLWGEEANTLGDFRADNFDLHQGYADLRQVGGAPLSIRIGRQALSLGGQRLIGAVEWTQQGRVFDGLRLTLASGGARIYALGFQLAEERAASIASNAYLTGLYAQGVPLQSTTADGYVLYNRVSGGGTDQVTLGVRWLAKTPAFRLEAAYQTGTRAGRDVSAYMLGARLGTPLGGKVKITLWYDYLSGGDDPADKDQKAFDTLFATNHKYYGYADLFLNIPVHTAGRGLQDLALKSSLALRPGLSVGADFHAFFLARSAGLESGHLGEELDATVKYKYSKELTLIGGYSHVFTADGMAAIGRSDKDVNFGYLMTNVAF